MMEQVIKECPQCKSVLKVTNTTGSRERTVKCPKCQTLVTVHFGDAPTNVAYQAPPSSKQTGTPPKNHKWLIAALVAIILILAGVVIGLLVSKGDKHETPPETQQTEQAAEITYPTGDIAKDAKAAGEKVISIMKGIKSMDDMNKAEEELTKVQREYEDFYKAKGEEELKKFNDALENDTELNAELEKVQEELLKSLKE